MPQSRRSLSVGLLVLVVLVGAVGCSSDGPDNAESAGTSSTAMTGASSAPTLVDASATGRELATEFLTILKDADTAALDEFLDESFQLQRADGSGANKTEYLADPAKITAFELGTDVVGIQQGDVLTVRWMLIVDGVINGTQIEKGEAPRLSTFVWRSGRWRMTSHANFVLPESSAPAPVLADPNATGRELVTRFIEILRNSDRAALGDFLADAFQIQRADGTSASRDEYLNAEISISSFEIGPTVDAVQAGDTLTVRWSIKLQETIDGRPTGTSEAPRLSAFVWQNGTWRLLSHANFNPPVS